MLAVEFFDYFYVLDNFAVPYNRHFDVVYLEVVMHTDVAYNISQDLFWPSQFLEIFLDILRWSTLQKWIRSLPLLSVAPYWKSSNIKAYAKNLSRILANNIDNRGSGISFIIYLRHCSFKKSHFCEINIIFCS